jgi:FkbM family methyltransferase
MNLRNWVKQLLRMCGHAFVGTVHEHLNDVDRQLSQVSSQLGELRAAAQQLAEADRALLQGGLRTIEEFLDRQSSQAAWQVGELKAAVDSLAEAEGALLQGGIRTIEELKDVQTEFRRQAAEARQRLDEGEARWRELLGAWQSIGEQNSHLVETFEDRLTCSHQTMVDTVAQSQGAMQQSIREQDGRLLEAVAQSQGALQQSIHEQNGHVVDAVTQLQNHLRWVLENEVPRQVCVETGEYGFTNPEVGLFAFLYSHLPERGALDIGANHGSVSELLLKAGYEVYAFEPLPEAYDKLVRRLGNREGFHAFPLALGSREAEMPLHLATDLSADKTYEDSSVYSSLTQHSMPADLPFTSARPVMVKTLEGLHSAGTIPQDIGLVKIDTEGYDLEVVRGMGERRYPVVAAEFWDAEIPFGGSGQLYSLNSMADEMRRRDYFWYIVLYRIWGENQSAFYCNHDKSIPNSWGNIVFFRDYAIFAQAQAWCSAALPRTYFKAAQG